MCLPISGWIWKTRNAARKTAAAKTDRLIGGRYLYRSGEPNAPRRTESAEERGEEGTGEDLRKGSPRWLELRRPLAFPPRISALFHERVARVKGTPAESRHLGAQREGRRPRASIRTLVGPESCWARCKLGSVRSALPSPSRHRVAEARSQSHGSGGGRLLGCGLGALRGRIGEGESG